MILESRRYSIAQQYFQAAQAIVARAKQPKLQEVFDFLCAASCLIVPDGQGGFRRGSTIRKEFAGIEKSKWLWIYVFDRGDLPHLSPDCINCLNIHEECNMAGYVHDNMFLKLRTDRGPFSMFAKGHLLLHEGSHARAQQLEGVRGGTLLHEYQTICSDLEWISSYGGKPYREILGLWVESFRATLEERLKGPDAFPEPDYPYGLDDVMGKSASKMETHLRKCTVYRHALFTLVQERYSSLSDQAEKLRCFCA